MCWCCLCGVLVGVDGVLCSRVWVGDVVVSMGWLCGCEWLVR